jgi:tripartite-type tricarboxylate transporter receptor subunit TctC
MTHFPFSSFSSRRALLGALAASLLPLGARAQATYPQRPVKLVVPFAVGGGTDVLARLMSQRLAERLGQPIVVDNRGGAGGTVGAVQVAKAAPDGYTLLFTSLAPVTIAPNLPGMKPGYDARRDLLPIAMVARQPVLLVANARLPVKNFAELVELANRKPGALTYATPGIGTELHLIGEMLKLAAGIDLVHVPYRGGGPAISDLIAGTVDLMPVVTSSIMPHVKSGAVRVLATTHDTRLAGLPDVPTLSETGLKGVVSTPAWGLFAPAGTNPGVVRAWTEALRQLDGDASHRSRLEELGVLPTLLGPTEFAGHLDRELAQWKQVIERAKLKAE